MIFDLDPPGEDTAEAEVRQKVRLRSQLAGLCELDDLASLGFRALLAATLATLMTGCVAGIFSNGQGVILGHP